MTLDEWLATSFSFEDGRYKSVRTREFDTALLQFGTNAIPRLVAKLRMRDLLGTHLAIRLLGINSYSDPLIDLLKLNWGMVQRQRALHGFEALGSLGTNAIAALLKPPLRPEVLQVFDAIGTAALPHLAHHIATGDLQTKSAAMSALENGVFQFKREETVAVWMLCLTNESASIRLHAARLIGNTTPVRAQASIPALELASRDADTEVAAAALLALEKLRPKSEALN